MPENINRRNLKKLANYLLSGNLKARFSMGKFADGRHSYPHMETTCGTVGCAVGHGPYAGIRKQKDEFWDEYSNRVFVLSPAEWDWCFSCDWQHSDPTASAAGLRIMWLLDHGLPGNWREQMEGKKRLCYRKLKVE